MMVCLTILIIEVLYKLKFATTLTLVTIDFWSFTDAAYSQRLLSSAKSLYEFANAHKGIYNKGPISDATSYYG